MPLFLEEHAQYLKKYLEKALEPISDADAGVLSDYAMALLRHESSEEEVRQLCYSQLEDFLRQETVPFVDKIFDVLRERSYLEEAPEVAATVLANEPPQYSDSYSFPPKQSAPVPNYVAPTPQNPNAFFPPMPPMMPMPMYPPPAMSDSRFMPENPGFYNPSSPAGIPPFPLPFPPVGHPSSYLKMKNKKRPVSRNDPYGAGQAGFGGRNFKGGPMGQRPARIASNDPTNTVLHVRNIPQEYMDEEKVHSFFSKFGILEKVELDPEHHAAILTFTSHEAAQNAWTTPEPIFNNRFIKIFWYNSNKASQGRPAFRKDFSQVSSESPDVEYQEDEDPTLLLQNEDFHKDIAEKQKLHEGRMKRLEENKKALEELNKRKQELALQQLEQQKLLMSKMREADPESKNNSQLLETQLAVLKAEAESLGIPVAGEGSQAGQSTNHHPSSSLASQRGSSAYRGRGRGAFSLASMSIDNRPTKIKVKNVTPEKNETLLQSVFSIGDYESIDELNPDERLINFQNRKSAERFYHGVLRIPSLKDVQLEWVAKTATIPLQTSENMMEDGNE
ncbi:MTREC (exosome adaptor) complex RNA-binding subunit Rmn1 [Schizosaccharomyces osmophilus]|uniref:MTREC (Exosome adaptor) complex RNA-binding subunit Rmn1 n=1 Tax=Schizosaccharomyces osmophilus TaxID=2545709 RepID=A0AAE9WC62_9SCHI|nr:MTREC (exosome adaptor) complex RNA-binding subunit Rmn1 [Schizosaccharomyces osmophilus]WBW71978.1 MTREC (exosome adaptor) complex RNA-binding subunit Rmn1 [Schizosaccharomyces osmophilus]